MINRQLRCQHAREIFSAGLDAVAPDKALLRVCQLIDDVLIVDQTSYHLDNFDKIFVIGAGKGSALMAKAIEDVLGQRITAGLITVKYGHLESLHRIEICEAGHPLPDRNGMLYAERILQLALSADEKTLVICLFSGGGSALLPLPPVGLNLEDKQQTTALLLSCGATIHEINTLRKHLSCIKGGRLAQAIYPATMISFILSDVVGDDLDCIASGPAVADATTFADCLDIVQKYRIEELLPRVVYRYFSDGAAGFIEETPKPGDRIFDYSQNVIIANNSLALRQAAAKAEELGYAVLLQPEPVTGEARDVAASSVEYVKKLQVEHSGTASPLCIISGGETTVTINGKGLGGRSQEYALAAAIYLEGADEITVLSAGTDGTDGPTDAAGACADETTLRRARELGLAACKFLDMNDSYHFFDQLGDLYKTGPTKTNVMDLQIFLVGRKSPRFTEE